MYSTTNLKVDIMKKTEIAFFDSHGFEKEIFSSHPLNKDLSFHYYETRLTSSSAGLAQGKEIACSFANDKLDRDCLKVLKDCGIKLIALRCAGFNQVDLKVASELGILVVRVPAYSPYAVAEHAVALLLTLNRKTNRAYNRVKELNFSLEGLMGFDLHGKTVGVIGLGKIGEVFANIMNGFGCNVLAYDKNPSDKFNMVELDEILKKSDIISLHVPLVPETEHLIDSEAFSKMKDGVIIINTGRGRLIDSKALIESLKSGKIQAAGLDVYEEEEDVFFKDLSNKVLQDDVLARLVSFPNVILTSHQAFLTREALDNIATTTFNNILEYVEGKELTNKL